MSNTGPSGRNESTAWTAISDNSHINRLTNKNSPQNEATAMTDTNASQDSMVLEHTFDAPVKLIWDMWTDPEHFKAWYGSLGAEIPVANLDVRVGGTRLVCMAMETPNGPMQMWFSGEFVEVNPTSRLVYTDAMSDEDGNVKSPVEMGMPDGHPTTTRIVVELEDRVAAR
ncbi:MAG: hypothetical protein ACI8Y4_001478 [Candidatus Poriferisodalaceae bacterium]